MLSIALTTLLTLTAAQEEPQARETSSGPEDVEIMRRLLVEAIDETRSATLGGQADILGSELSLVSGYYLSNSMTARAVVTHSRGFQAPGLGALFSIDARIPSVQANAADSPEEAEADQDDAWERVKRQIQTGQNNKDDEVDPFVGTINRRIPLLLDTFGRAQQQAWTLDPKAMQAVTDAVLETLASHGRRIREMNDGDSITVAIHFTPSNATPYPASLVQTESDETTPWGNWVSIYGASQAPEQRVVIQVPFGDLKAINGGGVDQLRRTAGIHRY